MSELETIPKKDFTWLTNSEKIPNANKCYLLLTTAKDHAIEINKFVIKSSHGEKFLGREKSIITFALRGRGGSIKMRTYANRRRGEVVAMQTFVHKFFN